MENKNELKDEELELVNGGGSGNIPTEGITFNKYTNVEANCYYAYHMNDFDFVVFVYPTKTFTKLEYVREVLTINQTTGTWSSVSVPDTQSSVDDNFMKYFPYQLNVRP